MHNHFLSFVNCATDYFYCLTSCSVRRATTGFVINVPNPCLSYENHIGHCFLMVSDCFRKLADDIKLIGLRKGMPFRDLERLEKWGHVNLLKFNQAKCNIRTWVGAVPSINTGWGTDGLRAEKDVNQQYALAS